MDGHPVLTFHRRLDARKPPRTQKKTLEPWLSKEMRLVSPKEMNMMNQLVLAYNVGPHVSDRYTSAKELKFWI